MRDRFLALNPIFGVMARQEHQGVYARLRGHQGVYARLRGHQGVYARLRGLWHPICGCDPRFWAIIPAEAWVEIMNTSQGDAR